jgi:membrane protease subunit HflC
MKKGFIWVIVAGAVLLILSQSFPFFTVAEYQQAVITQFGRFIRVVKEPGLHFKVPFLQQVTIFEDRLLEYDAEPKEIITKDKKTLVVDNYSKWKIIDPKRFYETVRNETGALARLDDIVYSELRIELGRHTLTDIVASQRGEIMKKVTHKSDQKAREYGIEVKDVRIKRADLPVENAKAIYGRMKAEREREAKRYRSEGEEEAAKIRAEADKQKTIILAEAYKKAQKIKGEGDASAIKIFAQALEKDPEFYAFYRTLEAYKESLKDKTTLILSPNSEFLRYLKEGR